MWRGPYYISGDLDSHPDVPYKEGAGGTNASNLSPHPPFHLLWHPLVAQQEARRQSSLLVSSMLVSFLDTGEIRDSWRRDVEVQVAVMQHKIAGRGAIT